MILRDRTNGKGTVYVFNAGDFIGLYGKLILASNVKDF